MTEPVNLGLCSICGQPAQFTDADPGANPVSYCARDLPVHLGVRAAAGQLPLQGATKTELLDQARDLNIDGRSNMSKDELAAAVSAAAADDGHAEVEPTEMSDATPDPAPAIAEVSDVEAPAVDEPKKAARRK
jgi:hypothetical protein